MPFLPLDGPAAQAKISLTISVVVQVKVGVSPLLERKAVVLQPLDGDIYVYFGGDGETPSVSTVQNSGLIQEMGAKETYEASTSQNLFILAVTATTQTIIVERA